MDTIIKTYTIKHLHKKTIDYDKCAYVKIKRSATNIFMTLTYKKRIIFSCTAGSAGLRKKERRQRHA